MHWFIKFSFVIVLFSLTNSSLFAQMAAEPVYINYTYIPPSEFKDGPGESDLHFAELNVITPTIKVGPNTIINNAFNYKLQSYNFDGAPPELHLPTALHDIKYTLIIRHKFDDTWGLLAVPKINIRGDYSTFGANNILPGGAVLVSHEPPGGNLQWAFGVTYNNDFRKNSVLPAAIVNYLTEKWRVNLILPSNGSITFLQSKTFEYGLYFSLEAGIYTIDPFTAYNSKIEYMRNFNALVAPALAYNFHGKFWLNLRAGYTFARSYDLLESDIDVHGGDLEKTLKPNLNFACGVSYRPF